MSEDNRVDLVHKSKIVDGFLGGTKPATFADKDVGEERRRVSATKSPTRLTYAASLLKQAQDLVKNYSFSFTHPAEVSRELQKFADAKSPAEKDEIFEKITNYGSVFKGKDTLRTALDQLFDKQQEMALTAHPIQPNKANTLQTEPVIVKINNRKYAVCVQDNEKYLVGLENQATNAMISAYNAEEGIKNLFSNSDLGNIKKITVKDKSQDIFYGTITIGGKNIAGHVVGVVVYKDVNGQYKTTVLDQTTYIDPKTGAERLDAKKEYRNLYTQQVRNIHSRIQNSYSNIQFDNNINFQYGVYPVEGNLASCSEVMAYFTDDLKKENFNVNKALTHIKEKISLPRMASIRFKATCTAMQRIEMKFNEVGLERTPLNKLNTIRNNHIIDDMGFLRKLTDAEYTKLTGIKVPVKTTQLSASPLQLQIAEQQVHKPKNLDTQLPTPALQQKTVHAAQDVAVNKVTTVTKEQTEINRNNPNNSLEQARQLVQKYSVRMKDENKKSLDGALEMFASNSYSPRMTNVCFNTICKLGNVPSNKSHLLRTELYQLFGKQQDVKVNLDTTQPKVAMPTAEPKPTIKSETSVALNPQLSAPTLQHGVASIELKMLSHLLAPPML